MKKYWFFKRLFVVLLLAVISVSVFWKTIFTNQVPFPGNYLVAWFEPWKTYSSVHGTLTISHKPVGSDIFRTFYPFKTLAIDMIKKQTLPLWNPYNGSGMPFMAKMFNYVFHPFNILFYIFSYKIAWSYYVILQLPVLAFSIYLYARKIGISVRGSIFSASIMIFSGYTITNSILTVFVYPFATLPLLLYLIEDMLKGKSYVYILGLPLTVAYSIFTGNPQSVAYVIIFTELYLGFRLWQLHKNQILSLKYYVFPNILISLGFMLTAVQLVPMFELFRQANINTSSSVFIFRQFLLPIQAFVTLFVPNYFGNPATYNYWGKADYTESIMYMGLIPCVFAAFSLLEKVITKIDIRRVLHIVVLISVLCTLDSPFTRWLYTLPIPILSTAVPTRIFGVLTFALAILAGYGLDSYLLNIRNVKKVFFVIYSGIALVIISSYYLSRIGSACPSEVVTQCWQIGTRNAIFEFLISFAILSVFFLARKSSFGKTKLSYAVLLLGIIGIGLYNAQKFLPFSDRSTVYPSVPVTYALPEYTKNYRVVGIGKANIPTDFATQLRFFDPDYYDPLYIRTYGELVSYANHNDKNLGLLRSDVDINHEASVSADIKSRRERFFQIDSVGYVLFSKEDIPIAGRESLPVWQDEKFYLIKNNAALTRAYFVPTYEVITNGEKILERLFDSSFNPAKTVILEKHPSEIIPVYGRIQANAVVTQEKYSENTVDLTVTSDGNELLVLTDNYYPGWKAFVDGKETSIYRANYTFRAIVVSQGQHKIHFVYNPGSVRVGGIVSIVSGLSVLLLFIYFYYFKNRRFVTTVNST
jgi:hypothetical protein